MNNKIIGGIVVALVILVIVVVSSGNKTPAGKLTVKIGVTLPLTGDVAMLGQDNKSAIQLAKDQLKDTRYNYELIFEDDQFRPATGASTANKLISVDNVSALISFGSPVGNVVSPIAEKAKVPHINDFASDPNVANGEYNFLHYTPPYQDTKVFIDELEKRNIKKIVFFGQYDNPGAGAIIGQFEKDVKGTDIDLLSIQKFNTGTRDFRTLISEVKNLNADIYVLIAISPEQEVLAKQIRESGITKPLTSIETFEFSDQLSLFEGMWYVNAADPETWFVNLFESKYGHTPRFGSANGYDALNLIVQAVEKTGDGKTVPTREQIKDALAQVKGFDGALGKNLSIDKDGVVISEAVIRMIKDGKPVTIK
jgi:branched-chain amino acid transport system substrate-binding protein